MKTLIFIVVLLVAVLFLMSCNQPATNANSTNRPANASTSNTNTMASSANDEADVKKLMSDLAAALAKNDADAASRFYADDYHLVTPEGVDQTKTERLSDMKSGATKFDSFAYENVNVRTYGDTAVAIATGKARGIVNGKPRTGDMRVTLVLRKMGDGWKVISGQATPIAATGTTSANTSNTNKMAEANKPASSNMNK